jgi:hypothetical protein
VRRPPHPGGFLHTRFPAPPGINQTDLAATLGISRRRVNELVNGLRAIAPGTAARFSTSEAAAVLCSGAPMNPRCGAALRLSASSAAEHPAGPIHRHGPHDRAARIGRPHRAARGHRISAIETHRGGTSAQVCHLSTQRKADRPRPAGLAAGTASAAGAA